MPMKFIRQLANVKSYARA